MIKILDSFIADKIAAGEVIERPVSIVKELVENSIDAGAGSIIVEIRNGGKSYIRVTDNGCGIPADEMELAFERHATSKISSLNDLEAINSLGFRGEALASIAAVSRLTVVSKTEKATSGKKLILHGGNLVASELVGTNNGTTMVIEDTFYNIPARRKFMGSDAREASAIIELIEHYAICYADIRFMLINNGSTIFTTGGNGDKLSAIRTVFPTPEFSRLIRINFESVTGFISDPGTTKNSKRGQLFFVNGRLVKSNIIEKGIEKGYGDRIFSGYPISILYVDVDPSELDVNIHPGKKEIKFLDSQKIIDRISTAINNVLSSNEAIPRANIKTADTQISLEAVSTEESVESVDLAAGFDDTIISSFAKSPISKPLQSYNSTIGEEATDFRSYLSDLKRDYSAASGKIDPPLTSQNDSDENIKHLFSDDNTSAYPHFNFNKLIFKGYVFNTYIIMQADDCLYIFDQHAAHERIFYEKLKFNYLNTEQIPQPILTPIVINVSADIYNADRQWIKSISTIGYDISDFGNNTFIIRGIPSYMSMYEADHFANEFIEGVGVSEFNNTVIDKLITKSCKAAVKANEKLSTLEINDLIKLLSQCENPFSCPHGRPTFVKISKYEIEKSFKRK